jgi:hypothetical protein
MQLQYHCTNTSNISLIVLCKTFHCISRAPLKVQLYCEQDEKLHMLCTITNKKIFTMDLRVLILAHKLPISLALGGGPQSKQ